MGTAAANLGDGIACSSAARARRCDAGRRGRGESAMTMAWLVFGLHAGWLVDRLPRRALMVRSTWCAPESSSPLLSSTRTTLGIFTVVVAPPARSG